ncbi:hypothetical protein D3P09_04510 [Paenibacillus pinisoli]|uniref:Uncharacterized protein n=1 Tax=Paenibacillus pinisoli TaxID=1276110 RepID=A0A3A6PHE8_9BACL|nr:hypothetical protein [Paenibacillus pinisoli]RJX41252.1 hypothetical protein D3P09_04510 [Paenibacillus pinisoli]
MRSYKNSRKTSRLSITLTLLVLIAALASGFTAGPKAKKREPVTLKAAISSEGHFAKYKGYLEEKFPHVTFELISVLD